MPAMKVYVESILPCGHERAWDEVQKSALLEEVAWPMITFGPAADGAAFPEHWQRGSSVRCRSYLFGLIPLGTRTLTFDRIDPATHEIDTIENDRLVRVWNHRISTQPTFDGQTRYSDEIEIHAGLLTLGVWLFASIFYRHRQHRWQKVAQRLESEPLETQTAWLEGAIAK
jgi:hypothetical protein